MDEPQPPNYRVISRRSAAFIVLVMVVLGGFAVLAAQQLAEAWIVEFQARLDQDPALAAAWLRERLRWFFLLAPLLLTAGALLVVWQGVGAVRSGHSPPTGAWIVAGQRTHAGRAARVRGHLQWLLGVVLVLATWAGSAYGYLLVDRLLRPLLEG